MLVVTINGVVLDLLQEGIFLAEAKDVRVPPDVDALEVFSSLAVAGGELGGCLLPEENVEGVLASLGTLDPLEHLLAVPVVVVHGGGAERVRGTYPGGGSAGDDGLLPGVPDHLLPAGLHPLLLQAAVVVLALALHQPLSLRRGEQGDEGQPAVPGAGGGEAGDEVRAGGDIVLQGQAAALSVGADQAGLPARHLRGRGQRGRAVVGHQLRHQAAGSSLQSSSFPSSRFLPLPHLSEVGETEYDQYGECQVHLVTCVGSVRLDSLSSGDIRTSHVMSHDTVLTLLSVMSRTSAVLPTVSGS